MNAAQRLAFLDQLFGLEGKTAVCNGGGGVLCGTMCMGLSRVGMHIIVTDISEEAGLARVAAIEKQGGTAEFFKVDVCDKNSMHVVTAHLKASGRYCDVLINASGINQGKPFLEVTDEKWAEILAVNLTGVRNCCKVFGAYMIECKSGGSIINIGSVTSVNPLTRVSTYSATKAAVLSITRSLAVEWVGHGIRVNALLPGFFPAEQNRKVLTEDRIADIMRHTPMKRFGKPEELIGPLLVLASPVAGSHMTGTAIAVDGGFMSFTL